MVHVVLDAGSEERTKPNKSSCVLNLPLSRASNRNDCGSNVLVPAVRVDPPRMAVIGPLGLATPSVTAPGPGGGGARLDLQRSARPLVGLPGAPTGWALRPAARPSWGEPRDP